MFPLKDNIPTERFPFVTLALIVANVIVFLLSIRHGGSIWGGPNDQTVVKYGAIPYELTHWGKHCGLSNGLILCQGQPGVVGSPAPQPSTLETVFSSMFMHGGLLHIAGNMLFLWIFGNNVEDAMGSVPFFVFYILGGIAALAGQAAVGPDTAVPLIGASGAIAAVLAAYLVIYPKARVLTVVFVILFFTLIEIPALWFLLIWFGQQVLFGIAGLTNPTGGGGGVAYFAHVGGFAFGLIFVRVFARHRPQAPPPSPTPTEPAQAPHSAFGT